MTKPLDQWIEEEAKDLAVQVRINVEEMAPECPADDRETLIRFIMLAVHQWNKGKRNG